MKTLGKVFILGDSYSTYEGYIPEGQYTYYGESASELLTSHTETWWYKLINEADSELLLNDSFSGTTICNTGYDGEDCRYKSFIGRLDKRIKDGYFEENRPDTFIIFGGTNDSWAGSPIGELKYSNQTEDELKQVLPAFCYLLGRVRETLPETNILIILNTELKPEIEEGFKIAADEYDIKYIQLENIEKSNGHPTVLGMSRIFEQVMEEI